MSPDSKLTTRRARAALPWLVRLLALAWVAVLCASDAWRVAPPEGSPAPRSQETLSGAPLPGDHPALFAGGDILGAPASSGGAAALLADVTRPTALLPPSQDPRSRAGRRPRARGAKRPLFLRHRVLLR